jgi:hypothetical protein
MMILRYTKQNPIVDRLLTNSESLIRFFLAAFWIYR